MDFSKAESRLSVGKSPLDCCRAGACMLEAVKLDLEAEHRALTEIASDFPDDFGADYFPAFCVSNEQCIVANDINQPGNAS